MATTRRRCYHLAPTAAPYVGLIGSRRKIRLIFDGLRERASPRPALARVAAPVGFDIGSQTVPEIAVSIVAELIARRNLGPAACRRAQSTVDVRAGRGPASHDRGIVPAAGRSERMGRPKLILPSAADGDRPGRRRAPRGGADRCSWSCPPLDVPAPASSPMRQSAPGPRSSSPAEPPVDMRASFELGLDRWPVARTGVLLAPGGQPGHHADAGRRVVGGPGKRTGDRRPRPSAAVAAIRSPCPGAWRAGVATCPLGVGINALVALHASEVVESRSTSRPGPRPGYPEDYQHWTWGTQGPSCSRYAALPPCSASTLKGNWGRSGSRRSARPCSSTRARLSSAAIRGGRQGRGRLRLAHPARNSNQGQHQRDGGDRGGLPEGGGRAAAEQEVGEHVIRHPGQGLGRREGAEDRPLLARG